MSNQKPYQPHVTGVVEAPPRPRMRVSTIVWGLVLATLGVWLLARASGFNVDSDLWLIGLSCGAGIALIAGSITGMIRNRNGN